MRSLKTEEEQVDENIALLAVLRSRSLLMRDLVDKALKQEIQIMTERICRSCLTAINEQKLFHSSLNTMASRDCSDIGLGKIMVVSPQFLLKRIKEKSTGIIEKALAHEIGHLRNWQDQPWCGRILTPTYCAYVEILAYKTALDIFKELRPKGNLKFLYKGKSGKLSKIFRDYDVPKRFIKESKKCLALKEHRLDKCPKEKEIREFAKIIKESKL